MVSLFCGLNSTALDMMRANIEIEAAYSGASPLDPENSLFHRWAERRDHAEPARPLIWGVGVNVCAPGVILFNGRGGGRPFVDVNR
jgi:hypothetical protein